MVPPLGSISFVAPLSPSPLSQSLSMRHYRWALLAVPLAPALLLSIPRAHAVSMASASAPSTSTSAVADPSTFGYRSTAEDVTAGVDLTGKMAIVTGGSSGIGTETARVLALRGASVVLAVRNTEAGEAAKAAIIKDLEGKIAAEAAAAAAGGVPAAVRERVSVMALDLASLKSVRAFAADYLRLNRPLHVLVNNAGVMMCPFMLTADGYENQFGTNHVGHFLLTNLLLPKLKETAKKEGTEARVVIVSSSAHRMAPPGGIRFDAINSPEGYDPIKAYGQSKLANILHARELARRLKEEGAPVAVNALHPGVIDTNLMRHMAPPGTIWHTIKRAYALVIQWFLKTIPQGAATSCFLAAHPSLAGVSGGYYADSREAEKSATDLSKDMQLAGKLWELSEQMVSKE
ncbi:hypothetical protein CLOM_g23123 [Closterium sp. NIES-68]|nr:hypothetical protein CLOM_g23123 [Closterium sp. NIES-68]GJP77630.1 hypothetical protein CLOP_g7990 [Closterium sp. NIES-67]